MVFKVEDGTGLVDANSYGTVAAADAYFADRGVATWDALDDDVKQAALIKATDYIEQRFGGRFVGVKSVTLEHKYSHDSSLGWPRGDTPKLAWNYDIVAAIGPIPLKLQYACFEYASRAVVSPLAPDPLIDASGVTMLTVQQKGGPVEQQFASSAGRSHPAVVNILRPYPSADMHLRELLIPNAGRTMR